jgi:KRAB domain-containing zinc finger protein
MTAKITDFFKITPISAKLDENSTISKIRECEIVLKDIKNQFANYEWKLFKEISLTENKSEKNVCEFCKKNFSSISSKITHIRDVHITECNLPYCLICYQRFYKNSTLNLHIKKKHPDGWNHKFECDFDGKFFKRKYHLQAHMSKHLPLVECKICNKMLKTSYLKEHLNIYHRTEKKFQCKICSKKFKSKKLLYYHQKAHEKKFSCNLCKKMFSLEIKLKYHKKNVHYNPGSFECEICGKKFNEKSYLKSHQATHKKNHRKKSLKCQRCDFVTAHKRSIKTHQKRHERQDQKFSSMKNPVKCDKCLNYYCIDKKALSKHIYNVHSPKKLFQCDFCAKIFKNKKNLIYHFNIHSCQNKIIKN